MNILEKIGSTETIVVLKPIVKGIANAITVGSTETIVVLKHFQWLAPQILLLCSTETIVVLKHTCNCIFYKAKSSFHRNNSCIETNTHETD